MCDPFWTGVPAGSTLHVAIRENTGAGVTGRLVVSRQGQMVSAGPCDFPLSQEIAAGTNYSVQINMRSTGAPATVVIFSEITPGSGSFPDHPDTCEVEVPAGGVASSRVKAGGV